jgi:hypothetical protein
VFFGGRARHVRIGAFMHAAAGVWRACTCGVPVLGRCKLTRFQTFDGDGGGAMPRGKHMGDGEVTLVGHGDWAEEGETMRVV